MGNTVKTLAAFQSARQRSCHRVIPLNHFKFSRRSFHVGPRKCQRHKHPEAHALDPRLEQFGRVIQNEYSVIRENYGQLFSRVKFDGF